MSGKSKYTLWSRLRIWEVSLFLKRGLPLFLITVLLSQEFVWALAPRSNLDEVVECLDARKGAKAKFAKNIALSGIREAEDIHTALEANFRAGSVMAVTDKDLDRLGKDGINRVTREELVELFTGNVSNIEGDIFDYQEAVREYWTEFLIRSPNGNRYISLIIQYLHTLRLSRFEGAENHRYVIPLGGNDVFANLEVLGHAGLQRKSQSRLGQGGKRLKRQIKTVFLSEQALSNSFHDWSGLSALIQHEKNDLAEGKHSWRENEREVIETFWAQTRLSESKFKLLERFARLKLMAESKLDELEGSPSHEEVLDFDNIKGRFKSVLDIAEYLLLNRPAYFLAYMEIVEDLFSKYNGHEINLILSSPISDEFMPAPIGSVFPNLHWAVTELAVGRLEPDGLEITRGIIEAGLKKFEEESSRWGDAVRGRSYLKDYPIVVDATADIVEGRGKVAEMLRILEESRWLDNHPETLKGIKFIGLLDPSFPERGHAAQSWNGGIALSLHNAAIEMSGTVIHEDVHARDFKSGRFDAVQDGGLEVAHKWLPDNKMLKTLLTELHAYGEITLYWMHLYEKEMLPGDPFETVFYQFAFDLERALAAFNLLDEHSDHLNDAGREWLKELKMVWLGGEGNLKERILNIMRQDLWRKGVRSFLTSDVHPKRDVGYDLARLTQKFLPGEDDAYLRDIEEAI